jgi:coenzyme F420 hydrogenase subunit beta
VQSKDSLIAYNILKRRLISKGYCTLCGACEAACPTSALRVDDKVNRLHDCSNDLGLCPICYEICPHSEQLLLRAIKRVSDAPFRNEALGYFRKIVIAQSNDADLREKSRGGAVVTSLLTYGIQKKIFDSAIVSQAQPNNPSQPKPLVAIVPDDIISAVGSKFFPSSVAKAYGTAVFGYGKNKIAFVGTPCHVLALRKMEAWHHKISDSLAITFGLFCFGTFSQTSLLEFIEKDYGIKPTEIKRMALSTEFIVQTEAQKIRIPIEEVEKHIQQSCRTCMDFSAELADISVGTAFPLEGWSTVILRTKIGEDFFNDAVKNGVVKTYSMGDEPNVFERVVKAAMQKRSAALVAASKTEENFGYLPVLFLRETEVLAKVKVEDIMTREVQTIPHDFTVSQLVDLMTKQQHNGYPVVNEAGEIIGVVTFEDAWHYVKEERDKTLVSQIIGQKAAVVYVGQTALDALKKMEEYETARVLVFDPADPSKLEGIVTKTDLMHALIRQS